MTLSYVYILAARDRSKLLPGLTSVIREHVWRHKQAEGDDLIRLVHLERFDSPQSAVARNDELQKFSEDELIALIAAENPEWADLSDGWFDRQACE